MNKNGRIRFEALAMVFFSVTPSSYALKFAAA
jgi:hypothetical protein